MKYDLSGAPCTIVRRAVLLTGKWGQFGFNIEIANGSFTPRSGARTERWIETTLRLRNVPSDCCYCWKTYWELDFIEFIDIILRANNLQLSVQVIALEKRWPKICSNSAKEQSNPFHATWSFRSVPGSHILVVIENRKWGLSDTISSLRISCRSWSEIRSSKPGEIF